MSSNVPSNVLQSRNSKKNKSPKKLDSFFRPILSRHWNSDKIGWLHMCRGVQAVALFGKWSNAPNSRVGIHESFFDAFAAHIMTYQPRRRLERFTCKTKNIYQKSEIPKRFFNHLQSDLHKTKCYLRNQLKKQ